MFVYIIGNAEQNIFELGIAGDPFKRLSAVQPGSPYKLAVICQVCVRNKNEAALVERLGRGNLGKYKGAGEWFVNLPDELCTQFVSGHFLRAIAHKAGVKIIDRKGSGIAGSRAGLQRLAPIARQKGLAFEDILKKVEQAYDLGIPIDESM